MKIHGFPEIVKKKSFELVYTHSSHVHKTIYYARYVILLSPVCFIVRTIAIRHFSLISTLFTHEFALVSGRGRLNSWISIPNRSLLSVLLFAHYFFRETYSNFKPIYYLESYVSYATQDELRTFLERVEITDKEERLKVATMIARDKPDFFRELCTLLKLSNEEIVSALEIFLEEEPPNSLKTQKIKQSFSPDEEMAIIALLIAKNPKLFLEKYPTLDTFRIAKDQCVTNFGEQIIKRSRNMPDAQQAVMLISYLEKIGDRPNIRKILVLKLIEYAPNAAAKMINEFGLDQKGLSEAVSLLLRKADMGVLKGSKCFENLNMKKVQEIAISYFTEFPFNNPKWRLLTAYTMRLLVKTRKNILQMSIENSGAPIKVSAFDFSEAQALLELDPIMLTANIDLFSLSRPQQLKLAVEVAERSPIALVDGVSRFTLLSEKDKNKLALYLTHEGVLTVSSKFEGGLAPENLRMFTVLEEKMLREAVAPELKTLSEPQNLSAAFEKLFKKIETEKADSPWFLSASAINPDIKMPDESDPTFAETNTTVVRGAIEKFLAVIDHAQGFTPRQRVGWEIADKEKVLNSLRHIYKHTLKEPYKKLEPGKEPEFVPERAMVPLIYLLNGFLGCTAGKDEALRAVIENCIQGQANAMMLPGDIKAIAKQAVIQAKNRAVERTICSYAQYRRDRVPEVVVQFIDPSETHTRGHVKSTAEEVFGFSSRIDGEIDTVVPLTQDAKDWIPIELASHFNFMTCMHSLRGLVQTSDDQKLKETCGHYDEQIRKKMSLRESKGKLSNFASRRYELLKLHKRSPNQETMLKVYETQISTLMKRPVESGSSFDSVEYERLLKERRSLSAQYQKVMSERPATLLGLQEFLTNAEVNDEVERLFSLYKAHQNAKTKAEIRESLNSRIMEFRAAVLSKYFVMPVKEYKDSLQERLSKKYIYGEESVDGTQPIQINDRGLIRILEVAGYKKKNPVNLRKELLPTEGSVQESSLLGSWGRGFFLGKR